MIDKSELQNYINRIDEFKNKHPNLDQANTKAKIIEPLIDILGWNKYSEDVVLNYQIEIGTKKFTADYALQLNNSPRILIKVQALGKTVSDQEINKLIKYCKKENIKWLINSNGEILEIYDSGNGISKEQAQLKQIKTTNLTNEVKTLNLITKEKIKENLVKQEDKNNQKSEKTIKSSKQLKSSKKELTSKISDLIKRKVPEKHHERVERSTDAFIKNLIKKLEVSKSKTKTPKIGVNKDIGKLLKVMPPRERRNAKDLLKEIKELGEINFILPSGKAWDKEYKWISVEVKNPGGRERRIGYIKTMNYGFFVQIQRPERNKYEIGRADNYQEVKPELLEKFKQGYESLI